MEIDEEYGKTNISLINLLLIYNTNKNFLVKLESLNIALNTTPLFLYMINLYLKEFSIKKYEIALFEEIKKEFNLDLNQDLFTLLKKKYIDNKKLNRYSKINDKLINLWQIIIEEIKISYINGNNIFSLFFKSLMGNKKNNSFTFITKMTEINYTNNIFSKKYTNIMEIKEKLFFSYNYIDKNIELESKNPKFALNVEKIKLFKEKFNLRLDIELIEQLLKNTTITIQILGTNIIFDKYKFSILKINFINYDINLSKDKIFINFETFLMERNGNISKVPLFEEKLIKLTYKHSSKTDYNLNVETTSLNFMVSQDDLNHIISTISNIYFTSKKSLNENGNNNDIKNINIEFKIPIIKLYLCENVSYRKFGEFFFIY